MTFDFSTFFDISSHPLLVLVFLQVDSVSISEPEPPEADGEPETSQPSPATPDTYTDFPSPTQSPTPPITAAPKADEPPHKTQPDAAVEPSTSTASPAKAPLAPVRAPVASPSPPLSPIKGLVERERLPSIPQSSSDAASHWLQSAKEESAASTSSVGQRVQVCAFNVLLYLWNWVG